MSNEDNAGICPHCGGSLRYTIVPKVIYIGQEKPTKYQPLRYCANCKRFLEKDTQKLPSLSDKQKQNDREKGKLPGM